MNAFAVFAVVAVVLLAYAAATRTAPRETFSGALGLRHHPRFQVAQDVSTPWVEVDPRQGTPLCPYGATGGRWHTVRGECCTGDACVPPGVYQIPLPPPADGDRVCPPGTTWGWGLLGGMCCGPAGCVNPGTWVTR